MKFSLIIPVFNRPDELDELLQSCLLQTFTDFDIIIIEDGSTISSEIIANKYRNQLTIHYYHKTNEGPAKARNYGATKAIGSYLIFTDSDCTLPPNFLSLISTHLLDTTEVFGGPDRAHTNFNILQKAISFTMTSMLTTGGVRGRKKSIETFYPRSFNMGIQRDVFLNLGGFPDTTMWPGEDMILAIELNARNFNLQYIHEAFVYHKRRTSLNRFFKQVEGFGRVRIYISKLYPHTFKFIYLFPLAFTIFILLSIWMTLRFNLLVGIPAMTYFVLIFISSSLYNQSIRVGLLSIITTIIQFSGYAMGFALALMRIIIGRPQYILNHQELFAKT